MANIALRESWIPIGKETSPFVGHYDGNNKEISNININQPTKDYLGLFGYIDNSSLSNIIIKNSNVSGQYNTGSLVGYSKNSNINNIKTKDNLTVNGIEDCGGLIGTIDNSDISNVSIEGTIKISVTYDSGALSGYIYNTSEHSITSCSVIGDDTSFVTGENAGGLIGYIYGNLNLSKCYSKISVTGTNTLGGLIGYSNSTNSIISDSYSDSSITANSSASSVGGLVGKFKGTLTNSYASGSIFLNCEKASYVGVTIGFLDNTSTVSNTFSSLKISVADGYTPTLSEHYAPSDTNTPLWWLKNSNYIFNTSETNYVSEGYKESLNWDSNVWNNLTEGALPTLKE